MWSVYAVGAAFFAALTAIFAKLGVGNVDSNLATAIRTSFILVLTWGIVLCTGAARGLRSLDGHTLFFLLLSALATGRSRAGRPRRPSSAWTWTSTAWTRWTASSWKC